MKKITFLIMLMLAGFSCTKEKDPCEGKVCENGGTCVDGTCQCKGLWKGEKCTEQITPLLLSVGSIHITKMPATDSGGAGWDLTSGPDIYVIIKQGGTVLASTQNTWIQNASVGAFWNTGFGTNLVTVPITIELWDYDDFDSDDFMGGVTGLLYNSTNKFPTEITTDCSGCTVQLKFGSVEYL